VGARSGPCWHCYTGLYISFGLLSAEFHLLEDNTDSTIEFLVTYLVALAVIQLMKHTSTHNAAGSVSCSCATTKIKLLTVDLSPVSIMLCLQSLQIIQP
jgi:hypothetical protein